MFGLSFGEVAVVLLIALLLFGGGKIADIGKGLGEGIKNLKRGVREADLADSSPSEPAKDVRP